MNITVEVNTHLVLRDVPDRILYELGHIFSFSNPKKRIMEYLGVDVESMPDRLSCVEEFPDGSVRLPRGAWRQLRREMEMLGHSVSYTSATLPGDVASFQRVGHAPRPYQEKAVEAMLRLRNGYVTIPCGGGKTLVGLEYVARANRKALIIVPTIDLMDQWCEEARDHLGCRAGYLGGGSEVGLDRDLVVAVDDSILARPQMDLSSFGVVIVDECHHAGTPTYDRILSRCGGFSRIGLSAQEERDDGLTKLMAWTLGPQLFRISYRELINLGYLVEPEVCVHYTDLTFAPDPDVKEARNMAKLRRLLASDPKRNELIVKTIVAEASPDKPTAVLSNNKAHCETLRSMCEAQGVHGRVLTSTSVSKKKRKKILDDMRSGEEWLIFATSLFDEGVNIKRLARILLAQPSAGKGKTQQKVGRALRLSDGKVKPVVHDFVDARIPKLFDWWKDRARSYRKESFKIVGEINT